jgi:hypothetical protein
VRIRSTKPEFWKSKRMAAVRWDSRFVLKALESYVDDNGVGKDDIELIVSELFSRDHFREPSRTVARVSEAISELHQAGLVWRYDHEGTDLLYLSACGKRFPSSGNRSAWRRSGGTPVSS